MLKLTDPRRIKLTIREVITRIKSYFLAKKTFKEFKELSDKSGGRFPVEWKDIFFFSEDATSNTAFDAHYIYHTSWAARILAKTKPEKHVDIASQLYFASLVSAFVPIDFYDLRPANVLLDGLKTGRADLTALPFQDNSVKSISCMHTIEHIGLGRYGDAVDPEGDIKAINEMKRVTSRGGDLLFVVPMGKPRLLFNAHRIYSYTQIMSYFGKDFELKDFLLIPDNALTKGVIHNASEEEANKQVYGCGCFWFRKK